MLIYNRIEDLASTGILFLLLISYSVVFYLVLVLKKKINTKSLLISIAGGILLTLLSLLIGNGNYGGTLYHERFGWPSEMYSVMRNIEPFANVPVSIPFGFVFNFPKILANLIFYSGITFIIYTLGLADYSRKTKKKG